MTTGRFIEAEKVAAQVAFSASHHASSIVGADLVIDGGALKAI
ncbi:hypothetical protein OH799_35115 [Nocardia sp. NBC_00881]|nr:hypothetical protein OH799_35115 [Nocardia sp. NBC_00881]